MSIEINQFNLNSGILNKYKNDIFHNIYWHKIIVENVDGLDREAVLKTIMNFCHPLHFIPVSYESSKNTAHFLMKNCGQAIEIMCKHNLIITNPFNKDKPFRISIKLCFANANTLKINIEKNAFHVLLKRFNLETKVLNLEHFANDPDLEEYCPLSQPKLLFYILHLARNIHFKTIKLCSNDIESLKPMEALIGSKTLTAIDLRNNNIKSVTEIDCMRDLKLIELWLDGNPICDDYDEFTYGRTIREHLPHVEKLDGVSIQSKVFMPFRRNFVCNQTGYDLVDQFLEHYFTLYDEQRSILNVMYHKEALFSLTSNYLPSQSTSPNARLSVYKIFSRNLLQMSDFSKNFEFLFAGSDQILNILKSLPATEHDPFSFTVDLIMYTEEMAVLVVGGVFREMSESVLDAERLLYFNRTFVLLPGPNGEYSIINEMMHISNATTTQAVRAFKYSKLPSPNHIYIPQPQNAKEMDEITKTLTTITGMDLNWSKKCLEECNYDLSKALSLFVDLYKIDKIPSSAFDSSNEVSNAGEKQGNGNRNIHKKVEKPYGGVDQTKKSDDISVGKGNMLPNGSFHPTTPTSGHVPTQIVPTNILIGNMLSFNPPKPITPARPVEPLHPIMSMQTFSPIAVSYTRNEVHSTVSLSGPMLGDMHRIIPARPIVHPILPMPFKHKPVPRSSLVNINLKK